MKKISILTFHTAENYGAVLQAYALQESLRKYGDEVKIIDFKTDEHIHSYRIFKIKHPNIVKFILIYLLTLLRYKELRLKKRRFRDFAINFLCLSETRFSREEDFLCHMPDADVYVSGSDQVFNPNNKYLKAYYLGFNKGDAKKIAYAPSFGISEFSDEITKKIKPFLDDFDALSSREQQGSEYLSCIMGKKIPTVLDPVFLLNRDEWLKIARPILESKPYIFVYDLNGGEKLLLLAKKIAQSMDNISIICATDKCTMFYNVYKQLYSVGPQELLGYIAGAGYVVTDSFHGTALSLVLRTKVVSYIAAPHSSSRITSIMNKLSLGEQIVYPQDIEHFNISAINFKNYQDELNDMIDKSNKYIQDNIIAH